MHSLSSLRWSLIVTWIATAVVSLWEWHGMSTQLLLDAGVANDTTRGFVLIAGIGLDVAAGVALLKWPSRHV